MSSFDKTPPPPIMVECPKCGFAQPKDQYCAKCGVDMAKVPQSPAAVLLKLLRKPLVLSAVGVFAIIITITAVRSFRHKPPGLTQDDSRSRELRARVYAQAQSRFANAGASAESTEEVYDTTESASSNETATSQNESTSNEDTAFAAAAGGTAPLEKAESTTDRQEKEAFVQVTFAWAEVSREWLQAMNASTPGPNRVPELEARLKESVGGYKVLDVNKQKLTDKQEPLTLTHGTNLSARFETATANNTSISGSIQPAMRNADGSVRTQTAAAVTIDKGQGSIITLGAVPATGQASVAPPGTTQTEIVLLILPRWGTDPKP